MKRHARVARVRVPLVAVAALLLFAIAASAPSAAPSYTGSSAHLNAAADTVAAAKPKAAATTTAATPADQLATLRARNRALAASNKALLAKSRALAAQAKHQTGRNVLLSNWIGELSKRLAALQGVPVTPAADHDQECRDYLLCTPEQDCRLWGNNCTVARPATPQDTTVANSQHG